MNCTVNKQLISEYVDGHLDRKQQGQVRTHLTACPECEALARDMEKMGALLRGLPASQLSPQFDSRLAQRLAGMQSVRRPSRLSRAIAALLPQPRIWRPALALGAAAAGIAGAALFWHPTSSQNTIPAVPEGVLVTHCVQQHRSYVGAQPLSDIAAQNLANQLDQTASAAVAPIPGDNDF